MYCHKFKKKYMYLFIIVLTILIYLFTQYWSYIIGYGFIGYFCYRMGKVLLNQNRISHFPHIESDISFTDDMTGIEFENYLCILFKNRGFQVVITPTTNDYGADLVLRKNGIVTVVQAKRYKGKVGVKAVQEVNAAIPYYKANRAIVVTNNYFTPNAISLAKANHIELIDRNKLQKIINER